MKAMQAKISFRAILFFIVFGLGLILFADMSKVQASSSFEVKKVLETEFYDSQANGLAYNGEYYIYLNSNQGFYRSLNGMDWTSYVPTVLDEHNEQTYYSTRKGSKIIWDGKQFVLAAGDLVATSQDGVTWKGVRIPYSASEEDEQQLRTGLYIDYGDAERAYAIKDLIYTGEQYVLVAQDYPRIVDTQGGVFTYGPNTFFYSSDLKTFHKGTKDLNEDKHVQESHLKHLAWIKGLFVADDTAYSTDGTHWAGTFGAYTKQFQTSNAGFVGELGYASDGDQLWTARGSKLVSSADGLNWTDRYVLPDSESSCKLKGVAFNGKSYMAFCDETLKLTFYYSQDGDVWEKDSIDGDDAVGVQKVLPMKDGFLVAGPYLYYISDKKLQSPSDWATSDVRQAEKHLLVETDLLRAFQDEITRSEFSQLVVRLYEQLTGKTAVAASPNPFTDTTNSYVLKAYQLGIIQGVGQGKFAPDASITRQDIAVMLYKTLKVSQAQLPSASDKWSDSYVDLDQIADYAYEALHFLNQNGIINGYPDHLLVPRGNATREQSIVMVEKLYGQFQQRIVKGEKKGFAAVQDYLLSHSYLILENEHDLAYNTGSVTETYYQIQDKDREDILTYQIRPKKDEDTLNHHIELDYVPGTDDYKIALIQNIMEKDKQIQAPDLSSTLLQILKTADLPFPSTSRIQYIEVNGVKVSYIISRNDRELTYALEFNY